MTERKSAEEMSPARDEGRGVFENVTQIRDHLISRGYKTTHYRVQKALERNELVGRRGGGWTRRVVEAWARQWLTRRADGSPEMDAPAVPVPDGLPDSVSERKALAHTQNLLLDARRKQFEFDRERGRYTLTETVAAELGARARAFRLGLERFGHEQAESVAADFGGNAKSAGELARRLGLEGDAARQAQIIIQDFALSRAPLFVSRWMDRIELLLDSYATGHWWTDDMRADWERYEEGGHADADH